MDARHYYPNKLVEARELQGRSQQEIAEAIKVDRQTVYRAEAGKSVSYELLAQLCKLYNIPMTCVIVPRPEIAAV